MKRVAQRVATAEAPKKTVLEPLSNAEFAQVCQRALDSALALVAWCSGTSAASLDKSYRQWCEDPRVEVDDEDTDDDCQFDTDFDDVGKEQEETQEIQKLVTHITSEAGMEGEIAEQPDELSVDLGRIAEVDDFKSILLEAANEAPADFPAPATLFQALQDFLSESKEIRTPTPEVDVFDKIWRLIMYMRHWRGGFDRRWIKDPRRCRVKTSGLNWYQSRMSGD